MLLRKFEDTDINVFQDTKGEIYFEVYSIGKALGYARFNGKRTSCTPHKDRINNILDKAEIQPYIIGTNQFLSEEQLYDFMIEAKTEKCRPFRRWITKEVLPTIRKTGGYVQEDREKEFIENMFPTLSDELKLNMVKELQNSVKIMKPKADYYDKVNSLDNVTNIRDSAKQIGVPEKKFIQFMLDKQFLYRDTVYNEKKSPGKLLPYAKYVKSGLFALKEVTYGKKNDCKDNTCITKQTFLTTKGKAYFLQRLKREGII